MQFQSEGGWLETQEELMFQFASEDTGGKKNNVSIQRQSAGKILSYLGEGRISLFVLGRPSTAWMRPTIPREDNLLFPVSADSSVNLIQDLPHRHSHDNV